MVFPFEYYVLAAAHTAPTSIERASGVYLLNAADARHLQRYFDPLYETHGIGICTSDDEVIVGESLRPVADAVRRAIAEIEQGPPTWPVTIGFRLKSLPEDLGDPIVQEASRERLLSFLRDVAQHVQRAIESGGCVHFGGGH